jgi:hypothetical protein
MHVFLLLDMCVSHAAAGLASHRWCDCYSFCRMHMDASRNGEEWIRIDVKSVFLDFLDEEATLRPPIADLSLWWGRGEHHR